MTKGLWEQDGGECTGMSEMTLFANGSSRNIEYTLIGKNKETPNEKSELAFCEQSEETFTQCERDRDRERERERVRKRETV